MAALDDAARAVKALLAPDEAVLFRQMFASDVPMEDIAKRIGLLRKATRKGKDMGGPIEEVTLSLNRLNELLQYLDANSRIAAARRVRRGGRGSWLNSRDYLVQLAKVPNFRRPFKFDMAAAERKVKVKDEKSIMQAMGGRSKGIETTNLRDILKTLDKKTSAGKHFRHKISQLEQESSKSKANSEALRIIMDLLGQRYEGYG